MKSALIIGGGFAGCAMAHQLALMGGWDVTLVESAPFLGAGVRTQWYGGHPHTFGPRHFLTRNSAVYEYLDAIVPLRLCPEHEFLTYVEQDGAFYNFPINMADVARMPDAAEIRIELKEAKQVNGAADARNLEEYWIASVGRRLYDKMVHGYTEKMWRVDCCEINTFDWSPKGVTIKDGARAAWQEAISGYPLAPDGYDRYFDVATAGATVLLNTELDRWDIAGKLFMIRGVMKQFDVVVSTIAPDTLFDFCYGHLPFMGRDLHRIVFPTEHVFPPNVYFLYYAGPEQFTRLVEYKKFTHHQAPTSLIGMEIPSHNGKYYPMPLSVEQKKAERYYYDMPDGMWSIGRAGSYRYGVDIDDCIEQAMQVATEIRESGREHPVPFAKWRKIVG
jgi:UDP-galactopyranose mutase